MSNEELLEKIYHLTTLLESVDEELAYLEDITHGEIGNRITELRKKLK